MEWVRVDYLGAQPMVITGPVSQLRYTLRPGVLATIAVDDLGQFLKPADGTPPLFAKRATL